MEEDCVTMMFMACGCKTCFVSVSRIPADSRIFRKIAISLVVIIFLAFFPLHAKAAQEAIGINFFDLANSDAGSPAYWDGNKSYVYVGGSATFTRSADNAVPVNISQGAGSLVFTTKLPAGGSWNAQFKLDWGHSVNFLRYGSTPVLYLRLKWAAAATTADVRIELTDNKSIWNLYDWYAGQNGTDYDQTASVMLSGYASSSITTWQNVYIPMSAFLANNSNLDLTRISILTLRGAGTYNTTKTMYIEKMKIVPSSSNQYTDMVKVNQLGYLPNQRKLAIVSYLTGAVSPAPTYFQVKNFLTGEVAYQRNLSLDTPENDLWDDSGDTVYHADFTSFTTAGRYVIYCPELGQSSPVFDIGSTVFNQPFRDALRFFYYARSGEAIAEPSAEGHVRAAIYANNNVCAYDYDDNDSTKMYDYDPGNIGITTRDVRGGWFDAGDLHLDIHNNVATLWFLLKTFEQFKNKLGPDILNLPESDSQTNDLVLLIKYQLDWFKKMQNADGSVHFIVGSEGSSQSQVNHQHVSDVSSGAACVLAGIFAKAYTVFSTVPGMETYSADLLSKAQLSWSWLSAHPNTYDPTSFGHTWSYGITDDTSYRSFAAIELYIATADITYDNYFETAFNSTGDAITAFGDYSDYYGWIKFVGAGAITMGYMDYIDTTRRVNSITKNNIKQHFLDEASLILTQDGYTAYNVPLLMFNDLYWGSSGLLCCNAYVLLRAYEWTGNSQYRDAAMDVVDWIGGRNPVDRVFITGYGDYLHGTDHYSFYMFDHLNPVPGYLCGNINMLDGWLAPYIKHSWKYYMNIQNASVLEPCLPWQAEMCYLLGYFASDLKMPAIVDFTYLSEFSQAWLSSPGDANWNPNFDLAAGPDSIVNFADFAVFANQWMNYQ